MYLYSYWVQIRHRFFTSQTPIIVKAETLILNVSFGATLHETPSRCCPGMVLSLKPLPTLVWNIEPYKTKLWTYILGGVKIQFPRITQPLSKINVLIRLKYYDDKNTSNFGWEKHITITHVILSVSDINM